MARALSSTLAMLQMHVVPTAQDSPQPSPQPMDHDASTRSFVDDLFSGVLTPRGT